jgi:hypothetical protein
VETRQEVQGLAVLEMEQITIRLVDQALQTQATVGVGVDTHLVVALVALVDLAL